MCEAITRKQVEAEVERYWEMVERPHPTMIEAELRSQFSDHPYQKWALEKLWRLIVQAK